MFVKDCCVPYIYWSASCALLALAFASAATLVLGICFGWYRAWNTEAQDFGMGLGGFRLFLAGYTPCGAEGK